VDVLTRSKFEIEMTDVRNIQRLARRFTWFQWIKPDRWYEHLFVIARKPS